MASQQQKIQITGTILGLTPPISGYYVPSGPTLFTSSNYFPANSSNVAVSLAFTLANLQGIILLSDKGCTLSTNGTSGADVQTISITGTPTGGTFPIYFNGQLTDGIPYSASASTVQTALQSLSSIGSGNVTCSGGPLPGTPVVCTFAGTLASGQQPPMVTASGGLTGGSSPAVSIAHTTPGTPTQTITLQPGVPQIYAPGSSWSTTIFTSNVTSAYVSNTPAQNLAIQGVTL